MAIVNFNANPAVIAWLALFAECGIFMPFFAVGNFGKKAGNASLTGSASSIKKVSMREAILLCSIGENFNRRFLSDKLPERFGAVFSVECGHALIITIICFFIVFSIKKPPENFGGFKCYSLYLPLGFSENDTDFTLYSMR